MVIERVNALRVRDNYFVVNEIVNIHTIDGEYIEQVCIDAITDDKILIDCGEHGNWLKFDDINRMELH